jgi:hypothetical protein
MVIEISHVFNGNIGGATVRDIVGEPPTDLRNLQGDHRVLKKAKNIGYS